MNMMKTKKDCLQVCLSELLGIDYDKIPKFYEIYEQTGEFEENYDKWLKDQGYFRIEIYIEPKQSFQNIDIPFTISLKKFRCLGVLKKADRDHSHAVILELTSKNKKELGISILDPKPNTDYSIDDIIGIDFILPIKEYIVNFKK